jgi:hypothetical protein
MIVKPLKWTKAEWRKDQLTGNWTHPSDNSPKEIEQLLDKYHKSLWHKRKMKLEALDKLRETLDEYVTKGQTDARVVNVIQLRLNQVVKKRLQYSNAMEFVSKLKVKQILDNRYLLDAFRSYLEKEHSDEELHFLIDVGWVVGSAPKRRDEVIAEYIPQGSPSQINIDNFQRIAIINGGSFNDAIEEVLKLLGQDPLRRFKTSNELKDALASLSQFNR